MANSMENFELGDEVYHRSNTRQSMVVINKNEAENTISCRFVDGIKGVNVIDFFPYELEKKTYDSPGFFAI